MKQPTQLQIPDQLIGRESSKTQLFKNFEYICRGRNKTLLIPGHSGVGKTSLVNWLRKPVHAKNGIFVQGKFDQYHQNTPYYAVQSALDLLWENIRNRNAPARKKLEKDIYDALGDLGMLLTEMIPGIRRIFPKPPRIEDTGIGFAEARHRFAAVIRKFLEVVSRPEHPVVMFIDDWQWADAASMALVNEIQRDTSIGCFLMIASYRDEEVGRHHPMHDLITELGRRTDPPEMIRVLPLGKNDIHTLVANTLVPHVQNMDAFITLIQEQTQGNPFYVKAFLEYLYDGGQIRPDPDSGAWKWTRSGKLPGSIVDLFARRLKAFDPEHQSLISLAAFLGNRFDLDSLATIANRSAETCRTLMQPFISAGFILPSLPDRQPPGHDFGPEEPERLRFMHDRIQQAAFLLVAPDDVAPLRLEIGRLLLSRLSPGQMDARLFEVLEHLNAGAGHICDREERKRMADLNMDAAKKARSATAFQAMLSFNRAAFYFAKKSAGSMANFWATSYLKALTLHRELAESEFLEGDPDKAEHYIRQSLPHTRTAVERAESLNILIVHHTLLARYEEAISSGRQALAEMEIPLPDEDFETHRDAEIRQIKTALVQHPVAALPDLPVMTDPDMLVVTKLLITLGPPCYRTHQRLWSVIVPKVVNITLNFGLVPQIGYSHTAFGGLLGWIENDYETAREFGRAAERIMGTRFEAPSDQSVFYLMIGSSIRHWFRHLRHASRDYLKAYDIGLQSGNLQYAAYAFGHNMYCNFYRAMPLPDLIRETRQSLVFSNTRRNHWAIDMCEGGIRVFERLANDKTPSDRYPRGEPARTDQAYLDQVSANKNIQVRCVYTVLKTFFHMLMNDYTRALELSDEAESLIYTVGTQGLLPWPEHVFTRFMILSALFPQTNAADRARRLDRLKADLDLFNTWKKHCPENHAHKYYLARAELAGIEHRGDEAVFYYDLAIDAARENGFLHWEGIANERAYRFWESLGNGNLAQIYRQQAFICYQTWGAGAKLSLMKTAFHDHLESWYTTLGSQTTESKNRHRQNKAAFIRKHMDLLERQGIENISMQQHASMARQTQELAKALERLREETAERKKAEEKLKANERRYCHAQRLGKVGNWEYDVTTQKFWGSDETKRIFGFDLQSGNLSPEHVQSHIREHEMVCRAMADLIQHNTQYDIEFKIQPKDSREAKVVRSVARAEADASGTTHKVTGVLQDITQRKQEEADRQQLELKLLQAQKMRAVGTLAGGIAHDFNNILYPILGFTEMSIQDLPRDHPVQENLNDILQGAKRAGSLVKQLLSFSKGKDDEKAGPLSLQPIIEETLRLLRSILPSNIVIKKQLGTSPLYIFGNATEIHEVVMNICTNAYHAMEHDGGTLGLHLSEHIPDPGLKLDRTLPYCRLKISDSGTGIPADIRDKIFDPYFTTKDQGKGSGLGLSVVHGIVKSCNGAVHVDSDAGKGTTLSIYLPLIPPPAEAPDHTPARPDNSGRERILLVDDEPAIVKLGIRILERLGYTVTGMTSSVEALQAFESRPHAFDLVITDMTMPGLLGIDLAKQILEIRGDTPILLCTGFSERIDPETARQLGIRGYISKPIFQEELTAKVRALLDGPDMSSSGMD